MMPFDPRYLKAIDCFNRGDYFEAHEAWEDYWVETMDEKKWHGSNQGRFG